MVFNGTHSFLGADIYSCYKKFSHELSTNRIIFNQSIANPV